MRIAIAGCSGTGKTTLAKAIAERFHLPLNPDGARTVAKSMGFDNPYDVDAAGKRVEFQKALFEAKREWELSHAAFVTDRSYLDNLTYCCLHMAEHLEPGQIERFSQAMERYDAVLILQRGDFQDLGDGIRKTATEYHELYEHLLMSLLTRTIDDGYLNRAHRVGGPLETRIPKALEAIEELAGWFGWLRLSERIDPEEGSAPLARKPSP
jgi:nicotinamide riboside kinase